MKPKICYHKQTNQEPGNVLEKISLLNNTVDEESMQYECKMERILSTKQQRNIPLSHDIVLALIVSFVIVSGAAIAYIYIFDYLLIDINDNPQRVTIDNNAFEFMNTKVTLHDIQHLRNDLRTAFDASSATKSLLATTVRLVFNDCSGPKSYANGTIDASSSICDGCIDIKQLHHAGLHQFAIEPLEEIYYKGAYDQIMSRSDFWIAAGTIAIEIASQYENDMQSLETFADNIDLGISDADDEKPELKLVEEDILPSLSLYFGRKDCESTPFAKENKTYPSPNDGFNTIYNWFADNFGFNLKETVAILGAHTLGTHVKYSGFAGNWVTKPWVFDHEYFVLLMDKTQKWQQQSTNKGNKIQYVNKERTLSMFNSDICLVYDIDSYLNASSGEVKESECDVKNGRCAIQTLSYDIVQKYATNNQQFYNDFAAVWDKLVLSGYTKQKLTRFS